MVDDISWYHCHFHSCVMNTHEYPFLLKYIDEYLKFHPKKVNITNQEGITPLMLASKYSNYKSNIETIKILLKNNADVNAQDKYGRTALMHALMFCANDRAIESVKILLKHGADVNIQDTNKFTALMYAVSILHSQRSEKVIKILIDCGTNIELLNYQNRNVITMAFLTKNIDILLPNRPKFIKYIPRNKKILLSGYKYWKEKFCDFKIIYSSIDNFNKILTFM